MKTIAFLCGLMATLMVPPAVALDKPSGGEPSRSAVITLDYVNAEVPDVIRALASQSGINVAMNPSVKGQVTVHLRNKTISEALTMVTNLAGLGVKKVSDTYVIAPRAEMRQTLERLGTTKFVPLTRMTGQAASDLAQGAFADLTAHPQGKGVTLAGAPEDIDAAEKLIKQSDSTVPDSTRVSERVPLQNRTAAQVAAALTKMSPSVTVEPAGNAVVVSGSRSDVDAARASVGLIDVQTQTDSVTRVYKIRYSTADQLVQILQQMAPDVQAVAGTESATPPPSYFQPLSGQFVGWNGGQSSNSQNPQQQQALQGQQGQQGAVNKRALTLILKGPAAAVEDAVRILGDVDTAPRQMMIEAKVVDTSPELIRNLGVEWSWNPFQFVERPGLSGGGVPGGAGGTGGTSATVPVGPLGFGSFGRVQFTPSATLNALITDKKAKLLASPQIAVVDQQDASIFIGDTLRFQTLAQSSATAGNNFTVVEVPVGIILLVHPRVNDDGNITLRVHPVVSTVSSIVNGLPQTSAREAETVVRVKDGDTIVIGGLIRDDDIRTMSKVPFLGDLPIIGYLFRNEFRDHRRSEVMVFLTIKLLPQ